NDYARASLGRKSTTGDCQFLGKKMISWQCKKQTVVANSTTKADMHLRSTLQSILHALNSSKLEPSSLFVISSHTKKVFANIKREGKDLCGKVTPLFATMMVQAPEDMGEGSKIQTDTHHTPIVTQPSSSLPQKKQKSRSKQRKEIDVPSPSSEIPTKEGLPTTSNDPLPSAKTAQAKEIASLKKRVKKLEQKRKLRTLGLKRLRKVEQGMNEEDMYGVNDLDGDEVIVDVTAGKNVEQSTKVAEKEVSIADPVTTIGEVVTTTDIKVTTAA
nr:retrovirus-related Pol polyprotein from transposon TNT 1-94 [Tanacetum cinerariifolium]